MLSFENKNVVFITTKNLNYIRNSQEISLIKQTCSSILVIGSNNKNYLARLLHVYIKLIFISFKRFDVVFIGFAPQFIIPFFRWKLKGAITIIDFFISFYDTLVFDRKKFKQHSSIAKLLNKIDKITINFPNYVLCDTKAHSKYFINEFEVDPSKLTVLYLEADKTIYFPRTTLKPDILKNKFIVLYFGSILPLQGIDIILSAIDLLKYDKELYFYIIGPIGNNFHKPISDNIEYIDWLSQEKLAEYISISDLCLAGHFNKGIKKASRTIPGKAYIYSAMGKRMILGDNEANRELFNNDLDVEFVQMGDSQEIANAILRKKDERI